MQMQSQPDPRGQDLEASIRDRETADDVRGMLDEEEQEMMEGITPEEIQEYLDGLPQEQMQFLATHLTPEFAIALGIATGNQVVADFYGNMADPSMALIPVPREMAEQLAQEMQGAPAPASQGPQPPVGPQGPMGM